MTNVITVYTGGSAIVVALGCEAAGKALARSVGRWGRGGAPHGVASTATVTEPYS